MSSIVGSGEMENNAILPRLDGSVVIRITTSELTAEDYAELFSLRNKAVKYAITTKNITPEKVIELEEIAITTPAPEKNKKTKSQIQRSSLYLWWVHEGMAGFDQTITYEDTEAGKKENKRNKDHAFETFYNSYMDKSIAFIQKHLPAES